MLNDGNNWGSYVISREIGRGGMGMVYLARDPKLDRGVPRAWCQAVGGSVGGGQRRLV